MDRGTWHAKGHRVAKSWTYLKRLSMYTQKSDILKYSALGPGANNIANSIIKGQKCFT